MATLIERELARARSAYVEAGIELARAMQRFNELDPPIDPGHGHPRPWTADERRSVQDCAEAWTLLLKRRHDYERAMASAGVTPGPSR